MRYRPLWLILAALALCPVTQAAALAPLQIGVPSPPGLG